MILLIDKSARAAGRLLTGSWAYVQTDFPYRVAGGRDWGDLFYSLCIALRFLAVRNLLSRTGWVGVQDGGTSKSLSTRVGQGHVFFGGSVMRFMMRFWLGENDSKQLKMNT